MKSIRCNTKDISNINVCLGKYFYGVDKWGLKQTPAQISHKYANIAHGQTVERKIKQNLGGSWRGWGEE